MPWSREDEVGCEAQYELHRVSHTAKDGVVAKRLWPKWTDLTEMERDYYRGLYQAGYDAKE